MAELKTKTTKKVVAKVVKPTEKKPVEKTTSFSVSVYGFDITIRNFWRKRKP